MMDLARVGLATAEIAGGYQLFLAALQGRYLALLATSTPGLGQIGALQQDAYGFGRTFLDVAKRVLDGYALRSPDGPDVYLADAMNDRTHELTVFFKTAVIRNIKQAGQWLSSGAIGVQPFTRPSGAVGQLYQLRLQQPEFKLPDAGGRDWNAYVLTKMNTRDALYQAEVGATVLQLASAGAELAQVNYPGHQSNGMVVALAPTSADFPTLASVRDKVFHPNSGAVLEEYHRV